MIQNFQVKLENFPFYVHRISDRGAEESLMFQFCLHDMQKIPSCQYTLLAQFRDLSSFSFLQIRYLTYHTCLHGIHSMFCFWILTLSEIGRFDTMWALHILYFYLLIFILAIGINVSAAPYSYIVTRHQAAVFHSDKFIIF